MSTLHNVTEHEKDGMRFFAARTGVKDLVSLEGSVHGGFSQLPSELHMVPSLAAGLFDADTARHDKETLRNALAARGATISFSVHADRTHFSATCFPEDLRFVCDIIVECLSEAAFKKSEVDNERARTLGELEECKTQTKPLASSALSRLMFDAKHTNYAEPLARSIAQVKKATRADLKTFQKMLGRGGLVFAVTGDLVPDAALAVAKASFSKLPEGTPTLPPKQRNRKDASSQTKFVSVPDKATIDTFFGTPVALTYNDPLYLPFLVLTSMLGGGGLFIGHLMRTIRERDGLTYGVYAQAHGFVEGADGALRIWATFSPHNFDYAVAQTRKEIADFFKTGITADALQTAQDNTAGRFALTLATSRGLASALHSIGREGKPLSYLDEYMSLIRAITLNDLHSAASLIKLDTLSLAAAGTFASNT